MVVYSQAMVMDSFLEDLDSKGELARDSRGPALTPDQHEELLQQMVALWNAGELSVGKNPDRTYAQQRTYLKSAIECRVHRCQKWTGQKYAPKTTRAVVSTPVAYKSPAQKIAEIKKAMEPIVQAYDLVMAGELEVSEEVFQQMETLIAQRVKEVEALELAMKPKVQTPEEKLLATLAAAKPVKAFGLAPSPVVTLESIVDQQEELTELAKEELSKAS